MIVYLSRKVEEGTKDKERFDKCKENFDLSKIISDFTIKREMFIKCKEGDINNYYDFSTPLGEGAYGIVYKGIDKETGELRAIK